MTYPDEVLREVGRDLGREGGFEAANVAVYFGDPSKPTPDPFFGGKGPERTGCNGCGGCMLGCRFGAKNTLDKNYLYLAEQLGAVVLLALDLLLLVELVRLDAGRDDANGLAGARSDPVLVGVFGLRDVGQRQRADEAAVVAHHGRTRDARVAERRERCLDRVVRRQGHQFSAHEVARGRLRKRRHGVKPRW
jgi:ferredoxin